MRDRLKRLAVPLSMTAVMLFSNACADDSVEPGEAGGAGGASSAGEGGGGGSAGTAGTDPGIPEVSEDPGCDLTGKWISVRRMITFALEKVVEQSIHNFQYWEIEQTGTEAEVKVGLRCGVIIKDRSQPSYSTITASPGMFDGLTRNCRGDGRRAVAGAVDSGECYVAFEKRYLVRGATVDYFIDPEVPLQEARSPAEGDTPGWEDWDGDGFPGVTFTIAGVANGDLYVAQRDWTEWEGLVPREAERFRMDLSWNTEQVVIEADPPDFPVPDNWPSTEPGANFILMHRVDDSIVGDTDLETCANTRAELERLLPEGFE
jgi:hypothetical protein